MSAWDLIGKANATKNGTPFAPGTKGEATILALRNFTSQDGKGEILVIEAAIETSEKKSDKYVKNMETGELAETVTQAPGSQVSLVFMLNQHKAAPGAAKAAILSIVGVPLDAPSEKQLEAISLAQMNNGMGLRGVRVRFDVHTKLTRQNKKTIHPVNLECIPQTEEQVEAASKKYPIAA